MNLIARSGVPEILPAGCDPAGRQREYLMEMAGNSSMMFAVILQGRSSRYREIRPDPCQQRLHPDCHIDLPWH